MGGWRGYQYLEAKKAAEAGLPSTEAIELSEAEQARRGGSGAFADLAAKAPVGISRAGAAASGGRGRRPRSAGGGEDCIDEIAADRSVGVAEQDLARIRAAQLLLETTTYPNMMERLEATAATGSTFRHTARELLALSAWRANDAAAARQWLDLIANDGETPPSLRSRAEALQALLPPVAKS